MDKLANDLEKRGEDEEILVTIKKNWVTMVNDLEKLGDDGVTIEKNLVTIKKNLVAMGKRLRKTW